MAKSVVSSIQTVTVPTFFPWLPFARGMTDVDKEKKGDKYFYSTLLPDKILQSDWLDCGMWTISVKRVRTVCTAFDIPLLTAGFIRVLEILEKSWNFVWSWKNSCKFSKIKIPGKVLKK